MNKSPQDVGEIRQLIEGFIQDKLDSATRSLQPDDPAFNTHVRNHQYAAWLSQRAAIAMKSQQGKSPIKVATHIAKAVHPDAQTSNLFVPPSQLPQHKLIGSHCIGSHLTLDMTGNAGYSPANYAFLNIPFKGETLADLLKRRDASLVAALNDDPDRASELADAFQCLLSSPPKLCSRVKQVYWLIGDNPTDNAEYHLLSPLYATSLAQRVFDDIDTMRFGKQAKEARKARNDNQSGDNHYYYPDLAVLKLGGSNTQNISRLNSKSNRNGTNYLLASLPPVWRTQSVRPIHHSDSAFGNYHRRQNVRSALGPLLRFLKSDPDKNMHTRDRVDQQIDSLLDELVLFSAELRSLTPGWSDHPDCRLPDWQRCWLDSAPEFDAAPPPAWPGDVCRGFALWLNNQLKKADLPVADPEHNEWARRMKKRLHELEEDLQYD